MSNLAEIEAAVESLPPNQQEQLLAFLQGRLARHGDSEGGSVVTTLRRAGLHTGVWDVASDFDAPLPDDFWLGIDT